MMPFYTTRIQNLKYDKEHKTFYTTQTELYEIGIVFGLRPSDTIQIKGITMNLEFQYSHSHGSVLVFNPMNEDYWEYSLLVDSKP